MPKSKNYQSYPEAFRDLVRAAAIKPIRIPCDSVKAAEKLRGYVYGFFAALKVAAHDKDTPEEIRLLYNQSTKVKVTFEDSELVAMPRDMDPIALQIAAALREQSDVPLQSVGALQPSADLAAFAQAESEKEDTSSR
jgi:hypothetical protein